MTPNAPLRLALAASAARTTIPPRPYAGSYDALRRHEADTAALDALVYGADEGRCPCCGCWLGFNETDWCDACRYDEADRC